MLGADAPPAAVEKPAEPDSRAYRAALAKAGKNADAQVRLALWCEAHGLTAERLKHLSLAVLYEPANPLARGLMGLVAYQGKWERPEQVSREVEDDPGQQGADQGISPASGAGPRTGRRPLEAGNLVRAERTERAGDCSPPPGLAARSQARERVEAPGV